MSTRKFRIGNDLTILWAINHRDGSPYNLSNKVVRLFVTNERGRKEIEPSLTTLGNGSVNNVIRWDFLGEQQKVLGLYTLSVEISTSPDHKVIKKDYCEAFFLVGSSCEEDEDLENNINLSGELILSSSLDVVQLSKANIEIGENGNWFIDGVDTGKSAIGGGDGLVKKVYAFADLGKSFTPDSVIDTFNAYAIDYIYQELLKSSFNFNSRFDEIKEELSLLDKLSKIWKIDADGNLCTSYNFYTLGWIGAGGKGEAGDETGGSAGLNEEELQAYLDNKGYVTQFWVGDQDYVNNGDLKETLKLYVTKQSFDSTISGINLNINTIGSKVNSLETWKNKLSSALKYNEAEDCWYINGKFYVTDSLGVGGISESGEGGIGGNGTITGIYVNNQKFNTPDEYGVLTLPDYPTLSEFDSVNTRLSAIENYFSTEEDAENHIDKWNEIVKFLNATEGTTLSGILAAYTLKDEFNKLSGTVSEHTTTLSSLGQTIDAHNNRISGLEEWYNSIGKYLHYDTKNSALYAENFYVTNAFGVGGVGEPGGTGGGSNVLLLSSWNNLPEDLSGYALGATLGVELDERVQSLEGGSGFSIVQTGSGNVITSISQSGKNILVGKAVSIGYIGTLGSLAVSDIPDLSSKYMPLSGGTMAEGAGLYNSSDTARSDGAVGFNRDHNAFGSRYFPTYIRSSVDPKVRMLSGDYTIIHSGNIGSQSVNYASTAGNASTLGGVSTTGFYRSALQEIPSGDLAALNAGSYYTATNNGDTNPLPTTYCSLSVFGTSYYSQQLCVSSDATRAWLRGIIRSSSGVSAKDWHELAFVDSNVESATKLATSRTIWGQSFDGTGNVSGDLLLNNGKYVRAYASDGTLEGVLGINSNNTLLVGYGHSNSGRTQIYGKEIGLYTSETQRILITSGGNIGIDTLSPTEKLHVIGNIKASGSISASIVKVGTITLTDENGALRIDGNAYTTGQNAAGAAGSPVSNNVGSEYNLSDINATSGLISVTNGTVVKCSVNATLNFSNLYASEYNKPCVIYLIKTSSCTLTVSGNGVYLVNSSGSLSSSGTVPNYSGLMCVYDWTNNRWTGHII